MTTLALIVGIAIGWTLKETSVWSLREALRWWRSAAIAAQRTIDTYQLPQRGTGRLPMVADPLPVRLIAGRTRSAGWTWLRWPGWGP